jgi:hypothetical protein
MPAWQSGGIMDVFIMWSGDRSHSIARDLKEFLEFVVQGPKYFISDEIDGGRLWRLVIAKQLEAASFGIACLTSDNLHSHWLHFEAGAISKAVGEAHVIPFLVGAKTADVEGPLADFQMIVANESGVKKLVQQLSSQAAGASADVVAKSFNYEWPKLEKKLAQAQTSGETAISEPTRSESAMVQEILDRVRRLETRVEPPAVQPAKITERPHLQIDNDMLQAMKKQVSAFLDELAPQARQSSWGEKIDGWGARLARPNLSAEELLDVYAEAKNLDSYLNR